MMDADGSFLMTDGTIDGLVLGHVVGCWLLVVQYIQLVQREGWAGEQSEQSRAN
jgi:hypothetical protein